MSLAKIKRPDGDQLRSEKQVRAGEGENHNPSSEENACHLRSRLDRCRQEEKKGRGKYFSEKGGYAYYLAGKAASERKQTQKAARRRKQ